MLLKKTYTTEELIAACSANNRHAQEALYKTYFHNMMAMCVKYLQDEDSAMDVLNVGFLKVFQNIHKFELKGSFEGWIRRIIYNTMVDFIRSKNNGLKFIALDEAYTVSQSDNQNTLNEEDIIKLIQYLPPASKTVFEMYCLQGYSHAEIAEKLSITESTSRWHLSSAREKLKAQLTDYEYHKSKSK